jgi:hypothetical protein
MKYRLALYVTILLFIKKKEAKLVVHSPKNGKRVKNFLFKKVATKSGRTKVDDCLHNRSKQFFHFLQFRILRSVIVNPDILVLVKSSFLAVVVSTVVCYYKFISSRPVICYACCGYREHCTGT